MEEPQDSTDFLHSGQQIFHILDTLPLTATGPVIRWKLDQDEEETMMESWMIMNEETMMEA